MTEGSAQALAEAAAVRWSDLPEEARAQLEGYLVALARRSGQLEDVVALEDAVLAVEAWWTARAASGAAVRETVRRQYGRGRRPALRELDRRQKRQALAVDTLARMRRGLEESAGRRNGHHQAGDDFAARLLAVPPASEGPAR
jgi:hypothetical protein